MGTRLGKHSPEPSDALEGFVWLFVATFLQAYAVASLRRIFPARNSAGPKALSQVCWLELIVDGEAWGLS